MSSLRTEDLEVYQSASLAVKAVWKRILCSVVCIQNCWRSHNGRVSFQQQRSAAISIQAWWRKLRCQRVYRRTTSAIAIQAWRRKVPVEREYITLRKKVIVAQCIARGWIAREQMKKRQGACLVIQRLFRSKLLRDETRRLVSQKRKRLAIKRRLAKQQEYREKISAASTIAAYWRGYTVRSKTCDFFASKKAIIVCQSITRGYLERRRLAIALRSIRLLQSLMRRHLARTRFVTAIAVLR